MSFHIETAKHQREENTFKKHFRKLNTACERFCAVFIFIATQGFSL